MVVYIYGEGHVRVWTDDGIVLNSRPPIKALGNENKTVTIKLTYDMMYSVCASYYIARQW